jgi:hypothetical protein
VWVLGFELVELLSVVVVLDVWRATSDGLFGRGALAFGRFGLLLSSCHSFGGACSSLAVQLLWVVGLDGFLNRDGEGWDGDDGGFLGFFFCHCVWLLSCFGLSFGVFSLPLPLCFHFHFLVCKLPFLLMLLSFVAFCFSS